MFYKSATHPTLLYLIQDIHLQSLMLLVHTNFWPIIQKMM